MLRLPARADAGLRARRDQALRFLRVLDRLLQLLRLLPAALQHAPIAELESAAGDLARVGDGGLLLLLRALRLCLRRALRLCRGLVVGARPADARLLLPLREVLLRLGRLRVRAAVRPPEAEQPRVALLGREHGL